MTTKPEKVIIGITELARNHIFEKLIEDFLADVERLTGVNL
jgi:hypothetical protein